MTQTHLFQEIQPGQRVRVGYHRGEPITGTVVSIHPNVVLLEDVKRGEKPWGSGPKMGVKPWKVRRVGG